MPGVLFTIYRYPQPQLQPHSTHVSHIEFMHICVHSANTKASCEAPKPVTLRKKKRTRANARTHTLSVSVQSKTILGWNPFWLHVADEKPELARKKNNRPEKNWEEDKIGDWLLQIPNGFYYFASLRAQTSAVCGEMRERLTCWDAGDRPPRI